MNEQGGRVGLAPASLAVVVNYLWRSLPGLCAQKMLWIGVEVFAGRRKGGDYWLVVTVGGVTRGGGVPEVMFCLCRGADVVGARRAFGEMTSETMDSAFDVTEKAYISFRYEAAFVSLWVLGYQPAKPVPVRHPDNLALYQGKLVFVFPLKVKKCYGLAVHFLIWGSNGELVIPRVPGLVHLLQARRGASALVFRIRIDCVVVCILTGLLVGNLICLAMVSGLVCGVCDIFPARTVGFGALIYIIPLASVTRRSSIVTPFAIKVIWVQNGARLATRQDAAIAPVPTVTERAP
jgi:hypothetical protein